MKSEKKFTFAIDASTIPDGISIEQVADLIKNIKIIPVEEEQTTKIVKEDDDFMGSMDMTECCKIGPLVDEKYCPNCGRKIIRL